MTSMSETPVFDVSEAALSVLLDSRSEEIDAETLAIWLEVSAGNGPKFSYDMYFQPTSDASPNDTTLSFGTLPVVIPAPSLDRLRGAKLDLAADGSGLVIINPNEPKIPDLSAIKSGDLTGPIAEQVLQVLDRSINPSIASHGGFAELIAVEGDTAYVRMGGGCQGCGMAKVTMSEGITKAIREAVPAILHVVDVTDHASGSNPYYEAAKK
jgi:Fe/S biogenesis protein NfuA